MLSDVVVSAYVQVGMAKEGIQRADEFLARFDMLGAKGPGNLSIGELNTVVHAVFRVCRSAEM